MKEHKNEEVGQAGTTEKPKLSAEELHEEIIRRGQELGHLWTDFELAAGKLEIYGVQGFKVRDLVRDIGKYGTPSGAIGDYTERTGEVFVGGYEEASKQLGDMAKEGFGNKRVSVIQGFIDSLPEWDPNSGEGVVPKKISEFVSSLREAVKDISVGFSGGTGIGSVVRKHGTGEDQKHPEAKSGVEDLVELYKKISDKVSEIRLLATRMKRAE